MGKGLLPHHTLMVIPGEYCGETRGVARGGGLSSGLAWDPPPPGRMDKWTSGAYVEWRGTGMEKVKELRQP